MRNRKQLFSFILCLKLLVCLMFLLQNTRVLANHLNKDKWEQLEKKHDYKKDIEDKKKVKVKIPLKKSKNILWNFSFLRYLIYGLVIFLIAYFIIRLIASEDLFFLRRKELKTNYEIENPDKLEKTILEQQLEKALNSKDYRLALRFQFLIFLEKLEEKGLIEWHKYKTNGDYLNELCTTPVYKKTKWLTYAYEYYWYGEHTIIEPTYNKLNKKFETEIERVEGHAK